jgi:uncharacterized repeat protein (TIGR01451 family)
MRDREPTAWIVVALWLAAALALVACNPDARPPEDDEEVGVAHSAVFTNGDFEMGAANQPPQGWTVTTNLNANGVIVASPETFADLQLAAGGNALTTTIAAVNQPDPDLGMTASLRVCRFGNQCARVNFHSSSNFGNGKNVNTLSQSMMIGPGDVDPSDGQVHVRFAVAPVLQNPAHPLAQQPYYFVQLTNVTQGTILYRDFNLSAQPGVPWKTINGMTPQEIDYVDWSIVDIAPGSPAIAMGDTVLLQIIGGGCSPGGHFGEIYVDGVGSTIPGLFVSGTGPAQANPGSNVTYTINYKNGGASPASGAVITFTTPPGTTFQSFTPPPGAVCVTPAVGMAGTITCTFSGPIPAGASGSMTVTVNITSPGSACTTDTDCKTGTPVCTTGAPSCAGGAPSCMAGTATCATGTPACVNGTAVCTLGQTCDAGMCLYPQIVAGNYGITSTGGSPLLGNKIVTTDGCTLDSQCKAGTWCDESTDRCTPTLANGTTIPNDPPHTGPTLNGFCTAAAGALVCTSGVCDASNNECGYANGDGPCTAANGDVVCQSAVCDPADGKCGYAVGDGPCATGAVCRSGACSVNMTCEPAGGCNVDGDCSGGKWCDESTHTCTAKLPNGAVIPSDPPHSGPTLNGTCTPAAAMLVCASGVCDADNACGYANGDGMCTAGNGGVVCRSGVCDPDTKCGYAVGDGPCDATNGGTVCRSGMCSTSGTCEPAGGCDVDADCAAGDWCDESMHTCTPQLANGAALPTDPPHSGPTLDGTCSPAAGMLVCQSGVCDTDNACGFANGDGPCTMMTGPVVCRSGVCSTDGTCEPMNGCNVDADCAAGNWCDETTHTCTPQLPNGMAIPNDPAHANPTLNGMCTSAAGALVCQSGVCDTKDNACGYANGDGPCTTANGGMVCRSGMCSNDGTCEPVGGCNNDADCGAGKWCNESEHMCTPTLANGTPVPTDPGHTNPTLDGTCTTAAGAVVCTSGVCDPKDNKCGIANGDGPCTQMTGATVCRSGDCAVPSGGGPGVCGCTMDSQCMGQKPICDSKTSTCSPCNGDNGSKASDACPSATAPFCFVTGPMAGACGKCTSNADCSEQAGTTCDTETGLCQSGGFVASGNGLLCAAPAPGGGTGGGAAAIAGLALAAAGLARRSRDRAKRR